MAPVTPLRGLPMFMLGDVDDRSRRCDKPASQRRGVRRAAWWVLLGSLFGIGLVQVGAAARIHCKAWLAQVLIRSAWEASADVTDTLKPWPGADTWPVARLRIPALGIEHIVLAGDAGRTLAFGPGHRFGSPLPGARGNSIIAAHRDTHFRFLAAARRGDEWMIEDAAHREFTYVVDDIRIVDRETVIPVDVDERRVTLVTCYPVGAMNPDPAERLLVSARVRE